MTRAALSGLAGGALLVAAGCGPEPCGEGFARLADGPCVPVASEAAPDTAHLEPLPAPRLLRRISLDLRGVPPTVSELQAVEGDPAALDALRDAWLSDPRLEDRLVYLLHEVWHTRVDELLIHHFEFPTLSSDDTLEYRYERAVGEEPLRLMARVGVEDRPWTDILTADWTMAEPLLEELWPLERADGEGWQPAHYTDARPAAGILSTNGLWWRYYTTTSNFNRSRAATLSKLLVCDDILARPVSFAAVEDAGDAGEEAVRTSRDCVGCHATVDPIASALFGFYTVEPHTGADNARYHPERALAGPETLGVSPAWYGQPVEGLGGLSRAIAADPRFVPCATQQLAGLLWREPSPQAHADELAALEEAFRAGDLRMTALLSAVTDSPRYRAGRDVRAETTDDAARTRRLLTPDQLASSLDALTGFAWTWQGFALLDSDTWGYRLLLGGVDGIQLAENQSVPSLTREAVVREAAWGAGVTLAERALAGEETVLGAITAATAPGDPAFDAATEALVWRAHGQAPDEALASQLEALWRAAEADGGPAVAWAALAAAVLSDPLFTTL